VTTPVSPRIDSLDLSVEQVYKDFYGVPDFQREYVWEPEDVEQFINDIADALYDEYNHPTKDIEYFIGSIVVCMEGSVYQLIDGQQRMTTLYLLLCAIRDFLIGKAQQVPEALSRMIFDTRASEAGEDIRDARLVLQYEDSQDVLKVIAERSEPVDAISRTTASIDRLLEAYHTLLASLEQRFGAAPAESRVFFAQVIRRVKLIRIQTPNLSQALRVFETINDRGVGLDAMDLLKNLLFMRASQADYGKLKVEWKKLISVLDDCGEKHLRFLRYFVLANYDNYKTAANKPLQEDEIYEWFRENAESLGIDERPLEFLRLLLKNGEVYSHFSKGHNPSKTDNRFLINILRASGRARQHLILMLAARHLPDSALIDLARNIEYLFFSYNITREPTKAFESRFAEWAKEVRACKSPDDVVTFISQRVRPELLQLDRRFDLAFAELTTDSVPKYRIRYILAKVAQHVDEVGWQREVKLDHYFDNSRIEIEHIYPEKPSVAAVAAFGDSGNSAGYIGRLGNLTLLEKPLNASIQNDTFSEKREAYGKSAILITRAIAGTAGFGVNTSLNRAVLGLKEYSTWAPVEVEERQLCIAKLARRVWGMDTEAPT